MKVFLFNIRDAFSKEFSEAYALGLGYIKSYFEKYSEHRDVEIRILKRGIWKAIQKEKPDLIGISSATEDYTTAIEFARRIKDGVPSTKIIVGGIHISNLPESFNPIFDVGVIGEGEMTAKELLETIHKYGMDSSKFSKIKGLVFFEGDKLVITKPRDLIEDIDTIPFPYRKGLEQGTYLQMMTSRGCPFKCTYCSSSKFWKSRVRFHSAEYVVNQMLSLIKEHGAVHITMWDDLFAINKKRLRKIVKLMKEHKDEFKNVTFGVTVRPPLVDEEMCKILKEMNVIAVSLGIESGSDRMLKKFNRKVTSQENQGAINLLKKYFIVKGGFILGAPEETLEDLQQTYDFITSSNLDGGGAGLAIPYPNTPWWDYALQKGLVSKDMDFSKLHFAQDFYAADESKILAENIPKDEFLKIARKIQRHFATLNMKNYFNRKIITFRNISAVIKNPGAFIHIIGYMIRNYFKTLLRRY